MNQPEMPHFTFITATSISTMRKASIQPQSPFSGRPACFHRLTAGTLPLSSPQAAHNADAASMIPSRDVWGTVYFKQIKISILCEVILCDKVYLMSFLTSAKGFLSASLISLIFITIIEIKFLLFIYSIYPYFYIVIEITFYDLIFTPKLYVITTFKLNDPL